MARTAKINSPINILKKGKKNITDKDELATINRVIHLIQGLNSGRIIAIKQYY